MRQTRSFALFDSSSRVSSFFVCLFYFFGGVGEKRVKKIRINKYCLYRSLQEQAAQGQGTPSVSYFPRSDLQKAQTKSNLFFLPFVPLVCLTDGGTITFSQQEESLPSSNFFWFFLQAFPPKSVLSLLSW